MRLYYVANMRFPNEKAHGKQVKEMCNALATVCTVVLLVPTRITEGDEISFGLNSDIKVVRIATPDTVRFGRAGFWLTAFFFAIGSGIYLLFHRKDAYVITREYACAAVTAICRIPTVWESHRGEYNWLIKMALHFGVSLVVISLGLKSMYVLRGVPEKRILVAPDGVDLARYESLPDKLSARRQLLLPLDKKLVIYNGHLHTWKGAGTLAEAAKFLPDDFSVLFMGGTDKDISAFRELYGSDQHIQLLGRKNDEIRPLYLRAADVAILPNTGKEEISAIFSSPLKLFGYMAAGVPIIASNLPSNREILSDAMAFFAEPDNPESFASVIQKTCATPEAAIRAENALHASKQFEWKNRATTMLSFLSMQ